LQISGAATLEQLSLTILQVLRWDKDHLYELRVHDRIHTNLGTTEQFVYADEPCLSCDIPLRLLGLSPKETFTFIFDFAYYHTFRLTVLDIKSTSKNNTRATLISYRGKDLIHYRGAVNTNVFKQEPPEGLPLVGPPRLGELGSSGQLTETLSSNGESPMIRN
jgi:hypothetical protein